MLLPQSSASQTDTYPVISCRGQCVESSILALGTPAALLGMMSAGFAQRTSTVNRPGSRVGTASHKRNRGASVAGGLCRGGRHGAPDQESLGRNRKATE
ncbi:hypothetical protein GHT06_021096 [Daphnia sinensis]|uniref:Uncharacterized protein n=1 Tax=Daphnia sinensis TaxID=1820382 RepID=A0AAD5PNF5_9CRUS|nr:hypothetical protein GHT06_021096 [Daphnia sinensis]